MSTQISKNVTRNHDFFVPVIKFLVVISAKNKRVSNDIFGSDYAKIKSMKD